MPGKSEASKRLDKLYLQSGRPIDDEARLRAVTAYMADFLVDTGELDLTLGRTPDQMDSYDLERMGMNSGLQYEVLDWTPPGARNVGSN